MWRPPQLRTLSRQEWGIFSHKSGFLKARNDLKTKFFALELFVVVLLLSLQYMPLLSRKFYSDPARPAGRYASAMKIRTRQSELLPKLMEQ
uniref:Uncharacterized protein n=1 Tax=Oryza glumipatula TaxID=40148 RepID=A0A0D9YQE7_9ORYZ